MNTKYLLPTTLLTLGGWLMPLTPASADTVLDNSVGFIQGTQVFTQSFDITTPGVLQVTLTAIPWLDTLQDLNCFLTSAAGGLLGSGTNGNFESEKVEPGTIYVNWFGEAEGAFGIGVYGITVDFQPAVTVPTPAALPLLLSGLAGLGLWRRTRRAPPPAGARFPS
jgi:hypothetical protein